MKRKFTTLKSCCVPISIENIDTDQIIPARFLKATTREGFGENLFRDWRYDKQGNPIPDFPLNNQNYAGEILVAGKNFGCGSSREHAAWAIQGYGFRVVVSSYFADIFKNNALNNFVLPVLVSEEFLKELFASIDKNPKTEIIVDLENKTISNCTTGKSEHFDINAYKRQCLLNGFDDVEYLLSKPEVIAEYEKSATYNF
ncbi:MAG: 3-isopropylmalate dehydratase small subunit [Prevotellaceae bacterium]|jgi:3-isopropylmalate/(R)-2-methylmalate dehydratase small subunit|nr:3-isopropylmalate dehydratase small subunit [Prevotellaceae bacterium]